MARRDERTKGQRDERTKGRRDKGWGEAEAPARRETKAQRICHTLVARANGEPRLILCKNEGLIRR